jgi:formamidopyrimidine-DNA glycosylase
MPELPEVETVRRGLFSLIVGRTVKAVEHDTPKSFPNATTDVRQFLIGAKIIDVRRRAKVLMIDLSTGYTLVIHLKMTGQMVFVGSSEPGGTGLADTKNENELRFGAGHPNESLVGSLPDRSTRVTFTFEDGSHLYFNDQRKFGWVRLMPTLEVPNIDFMQKVGPEPLDADFTAEQFAERFARRARTNIKAALLDQTVIAGVGNIYADESLWGAKIHPKRLVGGITPTEFRRLYSELRSVMNLAIEKGGSTDKNYVNAEGKRGSYMDFARVFRREGKPCPRCGTTIIKFKSAGRGTHICPHCQVLSP